MGKHWSYMYMYILLKYVTRTTSLKSACFFFKLSHIHYVYVRFFN
jgi:hypothetical protein